MNYPTIIPSLFILLGVTFFTTFLPIVSADQDDPFNNCATDQNFALQPIDKFQLKTVGVFTPVDNQVDAPSPVRTFVTGEGLTVHLFYEGASESVTDETLIDVTLYTVGDGTATSVEDFCNAFNANYEGSVVHDADNDGTYTFSETNGVCCSSNGDCGADCGNCVAKDLDACMVVPIFSGFDTTSFRDGGLACAVNVEGEVWNNPFGVSRFPAPCGLDGELLSSDLYNVVLTKYGDGIYNGFFTPTAADQCYPQTIDGVVAQAEIIMAENLFDTDLSLAPKIYDTDADGLKEGQDGRLQFCARIAYYISDDDDEEELISYIDTKMVLDVSLSADILFTQEISISSTDTDEQTLNTVTKDVSATIDVESFLCGDPGVNGGQPYADEYSLGQSFRVCVDVMASDQAKFALTNFGEVKCSTDSGSETIIISVVDTVATPVSPLLTTLFNSGATVGAASIGFGNTASYSAISFSTVLTNAYFTGGDETLTCSGSVDVETVDVETVDESCTGSSTTVEEFCECYGNAAIAWEAEGFSFPIDWDFITTQEGESMCCIPGRSTCEEFYLPPDFIVCTGDVTGDFKNMIRYGACRVPDLASRRHLVSFTVPNPMASSSLRRRMDEETGTALAGAAAAAEFGAIIKLSSSSSSLAVPGPFPVWATILIVIVCSVPCCLFFLVVWLKKRRTEKEEPEEKEETEDDEETE